MQLNQMLAAARTELADPRAQRPSYRYLLNKGVAVIQSAFNRLANTGRAWTVGETVLSVVSGVDEYSLDVAGIGKVLDVTSIVNSENLTEQQIPFCDLTQIGDDGYTSARVAFFRKDGLDTLWAKVRPTPTTSETLTVRYSTGEWAAGLDDSPMLVMHHHLFVAQIARASLAATEWTNDPKADSFKRDALDRSLSREIEVYERDFTQYIAAVNTPRITTRVEAFAIE